MLESLTLENFQKHQYFHIDFDSHVTMLCGASDQGKSSVIRALYWIMTNQLRGDYFIRHEADFVRGTLRIDGHEIVREKGKGKNLYQLDGGTPYEAFGMGVPEDIERLVNIYRTNFQLQLDSPFLFGLSPGDVSKELNSVVNLDLIDSALSFLASEQRKTKTSVQVSEERLEQAKQKRDELKWVKGAEKSLSSLEEQEDVLERKCEEVARLGNLIKEVESVQAALTDNDSILEALEALVGSGNLYQEKLKTRDALASLIQEITTINKKLGVAGGEVEALEEALRDKLDGKCPVCGSETGDML